MSVNIKLGSHTVTGVSSIKVESADTAGTYETFSLGTRPTLNAPSIYSSTYDGPYITDYKSNNGNFVESYDIYRIYLNSHTKIGTFIKSPGGYNPITEDNCNFSLGLNNIYAIAKATNFNDSPVPSSETTVNCYSISTTLSNCIETTEKNKFVPHSFELTLQANSGYELPSSIQIKNGAYTYTLNDGVLTALTQSYGTTNGFSATYTKLNGKIDIRNGSGTDSIEIIATATEIVGQLVTVNYTVDGYMWGDLQIRETNSSGTIKYTGHDSETVAFSTEATTLYIEVINYQEFSGSITYAGNTYSIDSSTDHVSIVLDGTHTEINASVDYWD